VIAGDNQLRWHSAIYRGAVQHRRLTPKRHRFRFPMFMLYLDLDELPELFDQSRWYSARGFALAQFRREDHLGDPGLPLSHSVRELVYQRTGHRPQGAIRLLTHLRYFGHCFNPASFYYCFGQDDETLECIVVEVNNTPWGEQHCYVLDAASAAPPGVDHAPPDMDPAPPSLRRWQQDKCMHVSPFMPMDMRYDFRLSEPGQVLKVYMQNRQDGDLVFDAGLELVRQDITARSLRNALLRFPGMSLQVVFAIHWQALRLWLKGVPVHDHPGLAAGKGSLT
jgi:DUF1365 family protein